MFKRVLTVLLLSSTLSASAAGDGWRTGWSTAPDADGPSLPAQTLRQVVRTSAGGVGAGTDHDARWTSPACAGSSCTRA